MSYFLPWMCTLRVSNFGFRFFWGGLYVRASFANEITGAVIDASLQIHRDLGPGLLESVYLRVLAWELSRRGFSVQAKKRALEYKGMTFQSGLRLDLLLNDLVVVELKSLESVAPVHLKQLLTYLRLLHLPVGLLLNFGAPTLKEGIHRVVNGLDEKKAGNLPPRQGY